MCVTLEEFSRDCLSERIGMRSVGQFADARPSATKRAYFSSSLEEVSTASLILDVWMKTRSPMAVFIKAGCQRLNYSRRARSNFNEIAMRLHAHKLGAGILILETVDSSGV